MAASSSSSSAASSATECIRRATGELRAPVGELEQAIADRASLLERLGRRDEAITEWEAIVARARERGYDEDVLWPVQEIARLREA
jgi:hypothetical protein